MPAPGPDLALEQIPAQPWWRLELLALPELEESLLWKLEALGVQRVALRHPPEAPERCQLEAWLPQADWPEVELPRLEAALAPRLQGTKQATKDAPNLEPRCSLAGSQGRQSQGET